MSQSQTFGEVTVEIGDNYVAEVEIHRPPNNHFDFALVRDLADAYEALDKNDACRVIVLCSEGKHFCAGANFGSPAPDSGASTTASEGNELYDEAARLIDAKTPVVAAVQGASIGGGLGLACAADFRVGSSETRMAANFAQLGFHHGFGLTTTLPPIVGQQRTLDLLLTGRRIGGEEAHELGLLDRLVPASDLRAEAHAMAAQIGTSAPLAITSIRATMRAGIGDRYRQATGREDKEQAVLRATDDFKEGVRAYAERRAADFKGR